MQLKPFLLDAWLDQYEHDIEFNLAASTGPTWTVNDILALADDETRHRFLNHNLVYGRPAGADSLREAIAEMQRVPGVGANRHRRRRGARSLGVAGRRARRERNHPAAWIHDFLGATGISWPGNPLLSRAPREWLPYRPRRDQAAPPPRNRPL